MNTETYFSHSLSLSHFTILEYEKITVKGSTGSDVAYKCDVIIGGMETIGSAERADDVDEMREQFHTISEGGYANLLYSLFGKERVLKELDEFLAHDFMLASVEVLVSLV